MTHEEFFNTSHGPKRAGVHGCARQNRAGGIPIARARLRAPAGGAGAGARSPQRRGGGGEGSRAGLPDSAGSPRTGAPRNGESPGPDLGEERGGRAPRRRGGAESRGAALERVDGPPRAHAVARRERAWRSSGGVGAPGIPAARQGAGRCARGSEQLRLLGAELAPVPGSRKRSRRSSGCSGDDERRREEAQLAELPVLRMLERRLTELGMWRRR